MTPAVGDVAQPGASWRGVAAGMACPFGSGDRPGPGLPAEPGVDQGAQVDGGGSVVQPGVVLVHAEVAQLDPVAVAGGGPGDDPLDDGPGRVGLFELRRAGLGA